MVDTRDNKSFGESLSHFRQSLSFLPLTSGEKNFSRKKFGRCFFFHDFLKMLATFMPEIADTTTINVPNTDQNWDWKLIVIP